MRDEKQREVVSGREKGAGSDGVLDRLLNKQQSSPGRRRVLGPEVRIKGGHLRKKHPGGGAVQLFSGLLLGSLPGRDSDW